MRGGSVRQMCLLCEHEELSLDCCTHRQIPRTCWSSSLAKPVSCWDMVSQKKEYGEATEKDINLWPPCVTVSVSAPTCTHVGGGGGRRKREGQDPPPSVPCILQNDINIISHVIRKLDYIVEFILPPQLYQTSSPVGHSIKLVWEAEASCSSFFIVWGFIFFPWQS